MTFEELREGLANYEGLHENIIPSYKKAAELCGVSVSTVTRVMKDNCIYPKIEKLMPSTGRSVKTRDKNIKVYKCMVANLLLEGMYPSYRFVSRDTGLTFGQVKSAVQRLKKMGLILQKYIHMNVRLSTQEVERVYEAVLLVNTNIHYSASIQELCNYTGLKEGRVTQAIDELAEQGRLTRIRRKHRSIQVVNTEKEAEEVYVGSRELKELLRVEYMTIVKAAIDNYVKQTGEEPTITHLVRITQLTPEAVRVGLKKLRSMVC